MRPALYAAETASLTIGKICFIVAFAVLVDCSVRTKEIANTTLDTLFLIPDRLLKPEVFITVEILCYKKFLFEVGFTGCVSFVLLHINLITPWIYSLARLCSPIDEILKNVSRQLLYNVILHNITKPACQEKTRLENYSLKRIP